MSIVNPNGVRLSHNAVINHYAKQLTYRTRRGIRLEHGPAQTVTDVFHRVATHDNLTKQRLQVLANRIIELSAGVIQMGLARDVLARALGYANFYHAQLTNGRIGPYKNSRVTRPLGVCKQESVV